MEQANTFWTAEDIERLQALRADGVGFPEIAKLMGRTLHAIRTKHSKIRAGNFQNSGRTKYFDRKAWSAQEIEQLKHLRDTEKLSYTQISKIMGRPSATLSSKHCHLRNAMPQAHSVEQRGTFVIPDEVRQDWLRRQMLSHRDLTSAFCGDPLPGQSALERRA